jgi:hypothetical protein
MAINQPIHEDLVEEGEATSKHEYLLPVIQIVSPSSH